MLLVFAHLLAASMALGAIVATDLRLLSKLSQDRLRIAPPNEFVARIVMVALLMLYVTGGGIVVHGLLQRPDYLSGNPKLQAKMLLVVLLTLNAFVLHKLTFPRLARGRRVARWHATDWIVVAVPVATSNFLWMFVSFLGIARPWSYSMPMRDIFEIAAGLYVVAQVGVFAVLAMAARNAEPERKHITDVLRRSLASLGNLGRPVSTAEAVRTKSSRSRSRRTVAAADAMPDAVAVADAIAITVHDVEADAATTSLSGRPSLRLVGTAATALPPALRRAR